jgi:putative glutamine amidotransferase
MFKIAVSLRVVENRGYPERRDAISHDWVQFLGHHGMFPLLIPNKVKQVEAYLNCFGKIHGILLTGGNDVGIEGAGDYAPERDFIEARLLEFAVSNSLPLLGICRGLHFLNQYYGGRVVPISSVEGITCQHVGSVHPVKLVRQELELPNGLGDEALVNSYHNNVVVSHNLSPHLVPFAVAEHGVVEGVKHRSLPFWAIQWHPERERSSREIDSWLFSQLKR